MLHFQDDNDKEIKENVHVSLNIMHKGEALEILLILVTMCENIVGLQSKKRNFFLIMCYTF